MTFNFFYDYWIHILNSSHFKFFTHKFVDFCLSILAVLLRFSNSLVQKIPSCSFFLYICWYNSVLFFQILVHFSSCLDAVEPLSIFPFTLLWCFLIFISLRSFQSISDILTIPALIPWGCRCSFGSHYVPFSHCNNEDDMPAGGATAHSARPCPATPFSAAGRRPGRAVLFGRWSGSCGPVPGAAHGRAGVVTLSRSGEYHKGSPGPQGHTRSKPPGAERCRFLRRSQRAWAAQSLHLYGLRGKHSRAVLKRQQ